jgi:NADPH:quinone reductase-like Zn-dependent oxidoreductase
MRAIVYERYGPPEVLEVRDLPSPIPAAGEVLVSVRAAALNPKDSLIRKGKFRRVTGSRFPRGLGYDVSGVVRAVGSAVKRLKVGDEVFGMKNGWAGGTVAQEVCLLESELALNPGGLSFEDAAAIPLAGLTALQALRDEGRLQPGQRVLIHGGSGGVGVFAIQVARALGAHVTTTSSARNLELCRSLGAQDAWDYTQHTGLAGGSRWDVFFDVFGNRSFGEVRGALGRKGTYVSTIPGPQLVVLHFATRFLSRRARLVVVKSNTRDLEQLAQWVEAGTLRAVIDRVVPLTEAAAAQGHVETRRARGKVVVSLK